MWLFVILSHCRNYLLSYYLLLLLLDNIILAAGLLFNGLLRPAILALQLFPPFLLQLFHALFIVFVCVIVVVINLPIDDINFSIDSIVVHLVLLLTNFLAHFRLLAICHWSANTQWRFSLDFPSTFISLCPAHHAALFVLYFSGITTWNFLNFQLTNIWFKRSFVASCTQHL